MTILLSVIIFLFSLFALSKDDFILLRKNVSLVTIFDITFFVCLSGLFFSRLFYAFSHPSGAYFNPLVFFVIPYFPGLSGSGLLLGGSLALYGISMRKKLPLGKMFDVFLMALLPAEAVFLLTDTVPLLLKRDFLQTGVFAGFSLFIFLLFIFIQKISVKQSWKDGAVALWSVTGIAITFLCIDFFTVKFKSLPAEFPYLIGFCFLIFLSFLIRLFKNMGERA